MLLRLIVAALTSLCLTAHAQESAKRELVAGMYRIEAEVVSTPAARAQGLMHRASLPPQAGMLFVFEEPQQHCFWMKNTLIPLSIAFLDDNGKIVNIADMQPRSEVSHCAARPVRYALEMNQGWFKSKGIGVGATIKGIASENKAR